MKNTQLKKDIKSKGMSIGFIEKEAKLPTCTLYNHINQGRSISADGITRLKKVLKKYKINLVV